MKRATELTRAALRALPLPTVGDGDKADHGRLLVVAGSRQVPGAAILSAIAALRSGAGTVRVATVAGLAPSLALEMPEVLVVALAESRDGGFGRASVRQAARESAAVDAIVAGPGVRAGPVGTAMARALAGAGKPLALDAGLLRCLPPVAALCRQATVPPILLPHSGELGSLLGIDEDEVEADRLGAARNAADQYGALVLAKGSDSHVAAHDGRAWTYRGGASGLGIAGSGDTLAGIVGALLARGAEPLAALLWGVLLHGEAGEALSRRIGPVGFLAREIPEEIPALLAR